MDVRIILLVSYVQIHNSIRRPAPCFTSSGIVVNHVLQQDFLGRYATSNSLVPASHFTWQPAHDNGATADSGATHFCILIPEVNMLVSVQAVR